MADSQKLKYVLLRMEGRPYPAYKDIKGAWSFDRFILHVDHVQGDPFAAPSRMRVEVRRGVTRFLPTLCGGSRGLGVAALLARRFAVEAGRASARRGSGKSGAIHLEAPGQEVLRQTAVQLSDEGAVEARFTVGLPADGRRVLGRQAAELLIDALPHVVGRSLFASAFPPQELRRHADANEDADALRAALAERGLVAFVADGAVLPRVSGVSERPLEGDTLVPFSSPASLRVTLDLPKAGAVTGMGIPKGVTLIVGGGYHGKSTLLRTLERGVYNHRPDDGRELVASEAGTVKIRAEDGRSVAGVDISPFITNLPMGEDTTFFSTPNASGSTSQAAAIMEAVEAGATTLLIDEDTAATNFMIRDRRMQSLIPGDAEPITPFVDRVRHLYEEVGVSTVLVLGGSGDYLDVADRVIALREYLPHDVTTRAAEVAEEWPTSRAAEAVGGVTRPRPRRLDPDSINPRKGSKEYSVRIREGNVIQFGEETIDLSTVSQIVSWSQLRGVAQAMLLARRRFMDDNKSLTEVLDAVEQILARGGLDVLEDRRLGDLAEFRRFELAAALNRLRTLRVEAE